MHEQWIPCNLLDHQAALQLKQLKQKDGEYIEGNSTSKVKASSFEDNPHNLCLHNTVSNTKLYFPSANNNFILREKLEKFQLVKFKTFISATLIIFSYAEMELADLHGA